MQVEREQDSERASERVDDNNHDSPRRRCLAIALFLLLTHNVAPKMSLRRASKRAQLKAAASAVNLNGDDTPAAVRCGMAAAAFLLCCRRRHASTSIDDARIVSLVVCGGDAARSTNFLLARCCRRLQSHRALRASIAAVRERESARPPPLPLRLLIKSGNSFRVSPSFGVSLSLRALAFVGAPPPPLAAACATLTRRGNEGQQEA